METFPIKKRKDEKKYGEYRTKLIILECYDAMAEVIKTGLPANALELLNLPIALPRGEYLALYHAGHKQPESVFSLPDEELRRYVGRTRVNQLIALRS